MKTVWITEMDDDNTKTWWLSSDTDICESYADAELTGTVLAKIISHGMYVGSIEEWSEWVRRRALQKLGIKDPLHE